MISNVLSFTCLNHPTKCYSVSDDDDSGDIDTDIDEDFNVILSHEQVLQLPRESGDQPDLQGFSVTGDVIIFVLAICECV